MAARPPQKQTKPLFLPPAGGEGWLAPLDLLGLVGGIVRPVKQVVQAARTIQAESTTIPAALDLLRGVMEKTLPRASEGLRRFWGPDTGHGEGGHFLLGIPLQEWAGTRLLTNAMLDKLGYPERIPLYRGLQWAKIFDALPEKAKQEFFTQFGGPETFHLKRELAPYLRGFSWTEDPAHAQLIATGSRSSKPDVPFSWKTVRGSWGQTLQREVPRSQVFASQRTQQWLSPAGAAFAEEKEFVLTPLNLLRQLTRGR